MKNFQSYTPEKYSGSNYRKVEEGIYRTKSPYDEDEIFVTSLSFETEPECYGEEDASPQNITQVPLEDIQKLRTIIGKRFYAVSHIDEKTGEEFYKTVLED